MVDSHISDITTLSHFWSKRTPATTDQAARADASVPMRGKWG